MPIFHDVYDPSPADVDYKSDGRVGSSGRQDCNGERGSNGMVERLPLRSNMIGTMADSRKSSGLDRGELIQRIKRGESPTWSMTSHRDGRYTSRESSPRRTLHQNLASPLLPAFEARDSLSHMHDDGQDNNSIGLQIERPRSALHAGDFRQQRSPKSPDNTSNIALATSPVVPWHHAFPAAATRSFHAGTEASPSREPSHETRIPRPRAISTSFSSNFILMPPTSPLVQQSNNTDLDFSLKPKPRQISRSPDRNNRRHTFSPHSLQTFRNTTAEHYTSSDSQLPSLRREGTFPYQAHQPRRSLNSFNQLHSASTPQTPQLRPRRPSISEGSPLQHAPMVGSYEESILRGRMSTTPSRPLNFVAQIGVLGRGQCKSSLRCPPHVTVPFPAVFYSYNSGSKKVSDNQPSPYVGLIDVENSLPPPEDNTHGRRRRRHATADSDGEDIELTNNIQADGSDIHARAQRRKREKLRRRSASPKAPPGGSYRIPQQGQLQIVIKNPNKTAVKLFLVPYDLADMEPGTKTFIRQRSYSAGPIIDMPLNSRRNFGTDRPEASLSASDDPKDRPVLRYLIHLHICCPSKGRYFLYKSIRVVFANRVPDGKEKLRNEVQLPEPRYSAYKPSRESNVGATSQSSMPTAFAPDGAFRRCSAALTFSPDGLDQLDGLPGPHHSSAMEFSYGNNYRLPAIPPIPFNISKLATVESRPASRGERMDISSPSSRTNTQSPLEPRSPTSPISGLATTRSSDRSGASSYDKLSRGDVGFGGFAHSALPGSGLLAQRLRGLDKQLESADRNGTV